MTTPDGLSVETEAEFQSWIVDFARQHGWLVFAPPRWTREQNLRYESETGYPDLTLVHPETGHLLFLEVKSQKGRLRKGKWGKERWLPGQDEWLDALNHRPLEGRHSAGMVRPSDREALKQLLERSARP